MAKAPKTTKAKAAKARSTARVAKRTARNSAKAAAVVKQPPHTVPGFPAMQICEGRGTNDNTIAGVISVNNHNDDAAVLNDGSVHVCSHILRGGVSVKRGLQWDGVKSTFLAMQRKERESAEAAKAVLARGTETESHCRKAVADNRKGDKKVTKTATKTAAKATKKAERAAKAAPKADDTRSIKLLDKKFSFGGDGTARRESWDACVAAIKAKTGVQGFLKAGGKAKYLPRWVSAGAIALS